MYCARCGTEVADGSKFCPTCGLDLSTLTPTTAAASRAATEASEEDVVRAALKDEYEIIKELGRGGMAIVFKAKDKQLDREVAVKVLPFSLAFDAEFVERFQREARTAARLEHPNIIPIYRVGRSGRVIYFVMKFLRGTSLSEVLERRGALPPPEIKRLLHETASALGYAHQNGVVHRDIKPDNIMFDEGNRAVITDFGIAKAGTGTRLTGTGMAIGTPHYMSPEQARAQPLDGRSDLYSLGVVAYQCLTGRVPFDGEDAFSIGYKHITEPVPVPDLPTPEHRALFEVIRRMMGKMPDDRFQTAEELLAMLEGRPSVAAISSAATVAIQSPLMGLPTVARPTTPTTPVPKTEPRPRAPVKKKRSGALVGLFLVLMLGGGGGGAYYWVMVLKRPVPFLQAPGPAPVQVTALTDSATPDSAAAPDSAPAAARADSITETPAAALPDSGRVAIQGAPARARITVDGEVKQSTEFMVLAGSRTIAITTPGYQEYRVTVPVRRGGDTTIAVRMARLQPVAQPQQPAPEEPSDPCADPGPGYNRDNACFDSAPRPLFAPFVPLDDRVQGTPTRVTLWIQVATDGRPLLVRVDRGSNDPNFTALARAFALQNRYNPAQKGGQPVEGWVLMQFVPQSR
ncbi:MAG TPA: protein kinase [Gemmatimonadales bacterium]|nr:protein kinase [Gemmatimonadales bacterium]